MDRKSDDDDVLAVAKALRSFPYSFVLVGGAAVPFLLTDPIVSARSTLDFDIVVRIATRGEYYEVEEWLRDHEFTETKDGPICRWRLDEHLIDVMPTSEDVLGFSNQWYEAALQSATRHELEEDISIPVVAAPPFVGAKIEAFRSRGEDDYYASSDLEDIITVLNGRPEIVDEVRQDDRSSSRVRRQRLQEMDRKRRIQQCSTGPPATCRDEPGTNPCRRKPHAGDHPTIRISQQLNCYSSRSQFFV